MSTNTENIEHSIITRILVNKRLRSEVREINIPKFTNILKNILKISIPAALETLLIGIIGLIDTMMVGGEGVAALAAVSICQQPVFMTLAVSFGLNAGITAIISRRKGENNSKSACDCLRQSIVMCIIIGIIMTALSIVFAKPFLLFSGANNDTIDYALDYFRIVSSVLVFNYIRLAICAALRAEGKTRLTLIINLLANGINLLLNYCLIGGNFGFPKMGVAGAALATAISNFVAFVIAMVVVRFRKGFVRIEENDSCKLTKETASNIINVSMPPFIEQMFMRFGFFLIAVIVNRLGTEVIAMNAIISGVISLAFNITDGFSIGAASLVGKSLGEENKALAFAYARLSQVLSFLLGLVMITTILLFKEPVCLLFSDDQKVIDGASKILNLAVFVVFPQSLQWVTTGALRGAGDVKFTARTSMLSVAIVRPILSYLLCYPIGLGLLGSWIGMFLDQTIRFLINNYRLIHLKWMHIKV